MRRVTEASRGSRVARSFTSSTPMRSPAPRTVPMKGYRSCIRRSSATMAAPTRSAFSQSRSSRMVVTVARAAADASAFPPKLEEAPDGFDQGLAWATSSRASTPEIGNPDPKPFPMVITSGWTPEWSTPHGRPVRPKPVIISSATSRAPISFAAAAREAGALLVADEMITGFARTGRPWGVDHSGVRPDVMTIGKGFGSGFPVSGVLARDAVAQAKPWSNPSGASSSYGGNALASAAALATVTTIRDERLWENADRVGSAMVAELRRMEERHPFIGHVRGAGLLIGVELVKDRATREPLDGSVTRRIYEQCLRRGLLAMVYTPPGRLQPALTSDVETALEGLAVLDEVLADLARDGGWR